MKYGHLFKDIIGEIKIETELNVTNCILTYDSKHVVAVCTDERQKQCDIVAHSLKTGEKIFDIDLKGEWIVMNEIE